MIESVDSSRCQFVFFADHISKSSQLSSVSKITSSSARSQWILLPFLYHNSAVPVRYSWCRELPGSTAQLYIVSVAFRKAGRWKKQFAVPYRDNKVLKNSNPALKRSLR